MDQMESFENFNRNYMEHICSISNNSYFANHNPEYTSNRFIVRINNKVINELAIYLSSYPVNGDHYMAIGIRETPDNIEKAKKELSKNMFEVSLEMVDRTGTLLESNTLTCQLLCISPLLDYENIDEGAEWMMIVKIILEGKIEK